ncbi:ScbA/BarX family gamma-butyrolactone biosynthesis protein [Streptomyces sp. NPDC014870]|uniref:ScbA/BarX family gamma-butyrolactone biosynthesis protein n=1 Tax=Streptomyces sp. NPDC014870 TaxID=3364925 RepID=UPI0036FD3CEC
MEAIASTATEAVGLTSTVPRQYVHRATHSEVLLTAWRPVPGGYVVTAQWPRVHSFYLTSRGLHDPLLLGETVRQTSCLLAHVALDVPIEHQVTLDSLILCLRPSAMALAAAPVEPELSVRSLEPIHDETGLVGVSMNVEVLRDGSLFASAAVRLSFRSPTAYDSAVPAKPQQGSAGPPEAVLASLVGRRSPEDVVLAASGTPGCWTLRVDPSHPVLFDHTVRHLPEALLVEAARQAATAVTPPGAGAYPVAVTADVLRLATFDTPCWIKAEPLPADALGRTRTAVRAVQGGRTVFRSVITLDHENTDPLPALPTLHHRPHT